MKGAGPQVVLTLANPIPLVLSLSKDARKG